MLIGVGSKPAKIETLKKLTSARGIIIKYKLIENIFNAFNSYLPVKNNNQKFIV